MHFANCEAAKRNMPHAIRYAAAADARSWASLELLLAETLLNRSGAPL